MDGESGAPAGGAFDLDRGLGGVGDLADDGESESGGGAVMLGGFFRAVIVIEDTGEFFLEDTDAVVPHCESDRVVGGGLAGDFDGAIGVGVVDCVDDEIIDQHGEVVFHGFEWGGFDLGGERDVALACVGFDAVDCLSGEVGEIEGFTLGCGLALGSEVGELEHLLDLAGEGHGAGGDSFDDLVGFLGEGAAVIAEEELGLGVDGGEGGFELVGSLEHVS